MHEVKIFYNKITVPLMEGRYHILTLNPFPDPRDLYYTKTQFSQIHAHETHLCI